MSDHIDFTDMLGKGFSPCARGPVEYDCYGVCVEVFLRYGIEIPAVNISEYTARAVSGTFDRERDSGMWERIDRPEAPCLVAIRGVRGPHVGVYIGDDRFIHVQINRPVQIDRITNPVWQKKIKGFYRYAG